MSYQLLEILIWKTIDVLDLDEPTAAVRDAINRAEKKGLISSAQDFVAIRKLRNQIAHEYVSAPFVSIFHSVLEKAPQLFDVVDRVKKYCQRFLAET